MANFQSFDLDSEDDNDNESVTGDFDTSVEVCQEDSQQGKFHVSPSYNQPKLFPFTLKVWIHRGVDLPVCDISTSDPYVVLYHNDSMVARTETIFKNCNPVWKSKEAIEIGLLHTSGSIHFRVFDEDQRSNDDPMGYFEVDIESVPFHQLQQDVKYPLLQIEGAVKACGSLEVSYELTRLENFIEINRDENAKTMEDLPEEIQEYLPNELDELIASEPVCNEIINSILMKDPSLFEHYHDLLTDLLYDARSLTMEQTLKDVDSSSFLYENENPSAEVFNETGMKTVRHSPSFVSSLSLDLPTLKLGRQKWSASPPLERACIELCFWDNQEDKKITARLYVNNKYLQSIWTLWLVLGMDITLRKEQSTYFEELPKFATEASEMMSGNLELMLDNQDSEFCQCTLSLRTLPYKILFESTSKDNHVVCIHLDNVTDIRVSTSYTKPQSQLLSLSVASANVYKVLTDHPPEKIAVLEPEISHDNSFHKDEKEETRPNSKISKGFLGGLTSSVSGLTQKILSHSSAFQAYNATSKLSKVIDKKKMKKIATEATDIPKRKRGIISRAISTTKEVASLVKEEAEHGFKKEEDYKHFIIIKSRNALHKTSTERGLDLEWLGEEMLIDISSDMFEQNKENSESKYLPNCVFIFLIERIVGKDVVIGFKCLPYSLLLPAPPLDCTSMKLDGFDHLHEIFLNDAVSLSCTIMKGNSLVIPPHAHPGGVYAVASFGAWNGANIDSSTESVSNSTSTSSNPVWSNGGTTVTLTSTDGLHWADYFRIALFDGNQVGKMYIGIVYIPISDFSDLRKLNTTLTYPVVNRLEGNYVPTNDGGYGTISIRLGSVLSQVGGRASVKINQEFHQSTEFNTSWLSDGILHGSVADLKEGNGKARGKLDILEKSSAEKFSIFPSFKGLVLLDIDQVNDVKNDDIDSLREDVTFGGTSTENVSPSLETMTIRCFENERRAFTHGLNWQRLKKCGFSEVDVSKSQPFTEKEDALPPDGFEWVGEWELDLTHHKTGENGWIYAVDFNAMRFNLRTGINFTNPFMQSVRRRRWNRQARQVKKQLHGHASDELKAKNEHVDSWRSKLLVTTPKAIIRTCKERETYLHPIIVPWNQVTSCEVITPCELCIFITINRFMNGVNIQDGHFRTVNALLFVCGCPAYELKTLLDERSLLSDTRINVSTVMTMGTLGAQDRSSVAWNDGSGHFEAEEMPFGSRVVSDLDEDAMFLERHVEDLQQKSASSDSMTEKEMWNEQVCKYMRRVARLRLYISAMLGAKLKGRHTYDIKSITDLMNDDFKNARCICLENDSVAEVNDQVEFLLDSAELRLREAALCGWNHKGKTLERCMQILVNGYLIEMVGKLGPFFESGTMRNIQGFGGKLELMKAYMKHNDRLGLIFDSVCKPYHIVPSKRPQLSYFLEMDLLIGWYSHLLQVAMIDVVEKCLCVWKDKSKGASRISDMYSYSLPWIPDRENARDGLFKSAIPEDAIRGLENYILYARVKKHETAPSFYNTLRKVDIKVHTSFVTSFLHLSEAYSSALCSSDWTATSASAHSKGINEEMVQLTEHYEWISSVINDSNRIISLCYCNPMTKTNFKDNEWDIKELAESTIDLSTRVYSKFMETLNLGIDWLSCIIFAKVLSDASLTKIVGRNAIDEWVKTAPDVLDSASDHKDSLIVELTMGVTELIEDSHGCLSPEHILQLISICSNKVISICLTLLRQAGNKRIFFDNERIL